MTPRSQPPQNWLQLLETWKVKAFSSESCHCWRCWLLQRLGDVSLACRAAGGGTEESPVCWTRTERHIQTLS